MQKRLVLMCLIAMVLFGCVTTRQLVPLKPGKVSYWNWNEGAYAHIALFRDRISKRDMFAINPKTGGLIWANSVLKSFVIKSAIGREWPTINYDHLQPNANYTMYIFWARFNGRELDGRNIVHFRTSIDPRSECRTGKLGGQICASVIVDLPRVGARVGKFSFHKTIYIGDWVKDLFGLP